MDKLMLLDGNSILNRAFYGIRPLTTQDGTHTNAVYGFINMLQKYRSELSPTHIAVAFDVATPTFRHQAYKDYKATRKGMPPELAEQLPIMKEVLAAMRIPILELAGYEADDVIGTVAKRCEEAGAGCVIVTGDRDDLQLITERTHVYLIVTRNRETTAELWDTAKMAETYHVTPRQFIDVKALMGDKSDNIPGVMGIGEKKALELIGTYGSLDALYDGLEEHGFTKAVESKLTAGREDAFFSRMLATIDQDVPITFSLPDVAVREPDLPKLVALYQRLEFRRLLAQLDAPEAETAARQPFSDGAYAFVTDDAQLTDLAQTLGALASFTLYLHQVDDDTYFLGFGDGNTCWCIPPTLPLTTVLSSLRDVLENPSIEKTSIHMGQLIVLLHGYGIELAGKLFDVSIGAYLLKPSAAQYDIAALYEEYTGISPASDMEQFGLEQDAYTCLRLTACLPAIRAHEEKRIHAEDQDSLLHDIELPLVPILASMQIEGFRVDRERLAAFREDVAERLAAVEQEIYALAGETFNISSPKQLGPILYEKLGLFCPKKNKTGYATDAETLTRIIDDHPIIEKILYYRQLAKLKSTYADGLLALIHPDTGKIHSQFNQTVAVTGRISSQDPNMQSIPVRQELGRELRRVFTARSEEFVLVGADYSQIELRVLAHLCGDDDMVDAFTHGGDIHARTASVLFGVPPEEVTPEMRSRAKTVNFGIIYGMGDFGLATDLHISRKEAAAYIKAYFAGHPKVDAYMKETIARAKEDGYVTTMFHRKRYVPELSSKNFAQRNFGNRVAMNTPIQGAAADIIKLAMIRVYNRLQGMRSRLILQVHDELIVDAYRPEADMVRQILKEEMEHVCALRVPLEVEIGQGDTWYDTK